MAEFATVEKPLARAVAPDGSNVEVLLNLVSGGMARFELAEGQTSKAVVHQTVEEIWYVLSGLGEMWRCQQDREETVSLEPGVCLTIPLGTRFQFRASQDLSIVAVTMPPWPGDDEAVVVRGPWIPTV